MDENPKLKIDETTSGSSQFTSPIKQEPRSMQSQSQTQPQQRRRMSSFAEQQQRFSQMLQKRVRGRTRSKSDVSDRDPELVQNISSQLSNINIERNPNKDAQLSQMTDISEPDLSRPMRLTPDSVKRVRTERVKGLQIHKKEPKRKPLKVPTKPKRATAARKRSREEFDESAEKEKDGNKRRKTLASSQPTSDKQPKRRSQRLMAKSQKESTPITPPKLGVTTRSKRVQKTKQKAKTQTTIVGDSKKLLSISKRKTNTKNVAISLVSDEDKDNDKGEEMEWSEDQELETTMKRSPKASKVSKSSKTKWGDKELEYLKLCYDKHKKLCAPGKAYPIWQSMKQDKNYGKYFVHRTEYAIRDKARLLWETAKK